MKKIFGEKGILNGKRVLAATLVIDFIVWYYIVFSWHRSYMEVSGKS